MNRPQRLIATGGGTGGHVYPALTILEAARRATAGSGGLELLYLGSAGGMEESLVARAGLPFEAVSSGAVLGGNPLSIAGGLARTVLGVAQAWWRMRSARPDAVLATGGYVSVPVVLAARLRGAPILVYLPDMKPGLAVRFTSRFADRVAVTFPEAAYYLPPAKVVVTGYPVRPELFGRERTEARRRLSLAPDLPLLLALGGSRGSQSINSALVDSLPRLLQRLQVLHVTGEGQETTPASELPAALGDRYHVYSYLHEELPDALAAADLVLSRSGASVMGEYPAAGLPSILVPYPYAGAHQRLNAQRLADSGAALLISDGELTSRLSDAVLGLLDEPERLAAMRKAASSLARPEAASTIAGLLLELAGNAAASATKGR